MREREGGREGGREREKIEATRLMKSGYAIFLLKDGRKLPKEYDDLLFCLF